MHCMQKILIYLLKTKIDKDKQTTVFESDVFIEDDKKIF